jgi:hypothetical protein
MNLKRLKINLKINLMVSSQLFETLRHSSLVAVLLSYTALKIVRSLNISALQSRGDWSKTGRFSFSPYRALRDLFSFAVLSGNAAWL